MSVCSCMTWFCITHANEKYRKQTRLWNHERHAISHPYRHAVGAFCNYFNTLRPKQNGRHFTDNRLKCFFLNENAWISIKISLKFVPECPINNIAALVQRLAWRQSGAKPLSEPMMVRLLRHLCITQPQWVNILVHASCSYNLKWVIF